MPFGPSSLSSSGKHPRRAGEAHTAPACALASGFARVRDPLALCALLPADAMIHQHSRLFSASLSTPRQGGSFTNHPGDLCHPLHLPGHRLWLPPSRRTHRRRLPRAALRRKTRPPHPPPLTCMRPIRLECRHVHLARRSFSGNAGVCSPRRFHGGIPHRRPSPHRPR